MENKFNFFSRHIFNLLSRAHLNLYSLLKPKIVLKINKLNPAAKIPKKAYDGKYADAAYDLYCCESTQVSLLPKTHTIISTGIRVILPDGYCLKFRGRSGLAAKYGLIVGGGVIDTSYTGELKVILINPLNFSVIISPGDRIAQFVVEEVLDTEISEISDSEFFKLSLDRDRKGNGFGSSGS